jgi:probable rRNA maturation factor
VPVLIEFETEGRFSTAEKDKMVRLAECLVTLCLRSEGRGDSEWEVSVLFASDAFIAGLNKEWRGIDGPTDVLSFALNEGEEPVTLDIEGMPDVLGDIVISLDTAAREATSAGKSLDEEILLLLTHGTLHLLGYDHETLEKEAVMWKRQDEILSAYLMKNRA